jgi:hypothetical protein
MNKRSWIISLAVLLTIASGQTGPSAAQTQPDFPLPELGADSSQKMRADASSAVYAAVLRMRGAGDAETENVLFTQQAAKALAEDPHRYVGFGMPFYSVRSFMQDRASENTYYMSVGLYFVDAVKRRSAAVCSLKYMVSGDQIIVTEAGLSPIVPPKPRCVLSFVPQEKVPADLLAKHGSHTDLLSWVLENAIPLDSPAAIPTNTRDYCVFAFTMDRLAPKATLQIRVSNEKDGPAGEGGSSDLDYEGWHVAVLKGKFALGTDPEFWFKLLYTPGQDGDESGQEAKVIALYSSKLQVVPVAVPGDTTVNSFRPSVDDTGGAAAIVAGSDEFAVKDADAYEYSYRNWDKANSGAHGSMRISSNVNGIPKTRRRVYISFDVASLAGKLEGIEKVELQLHRYEGMPGTTNVNLHRVLEPWKEGDGTYHPGTNEPPAAPGTLSWVNQPKWDAQTVWATQTLHHAKEVYPVRWDITKLVKAWLAGQFPNHGIVIIGEKEGQASYAHGFISSDHKNEAHRPRIIVTRAKAPSSSGTAEAPVTGVTPDPRTAYQQYIAAYNRLTHLMSEGKGDTPEAQEAYQAYKRAKELYEKLIRR